MVSLARGSHAKAADPHFQTQKPVQRKEAVPRRLASVAPVRQKSLCGRTTRTTAVADGDRAQTVLQLGRLELLQVPRAKPSRRGSRRCSCGLRVRRPHPSAAPPQKAAGGPAMGPASGPP